ncbi:MAG: hypothetical protein HC842_06450 [Cytophagales bacterium]|nr:hypothetical protein [Cytophagales bacterium]
MNLNVKFVKSVLNIHEEMIENGMSLVYMGEFNHDITKMFTALAENNMERKNEETQTKKKVFHVMVETLQNMNKHSDEMSEDVEVGNGLFIIGRKRGSYYIITLNKVSAEKRDGLEDKVHEVNNSSADELKEMYKRQIKEGRLSEKGGAGLGLIDIARKTGKKLEYILLPIDDEENNYLFVLKVEVDTLSPIKKLSSDVIGAEAAE